MDPNRLGLFDSKNKILKDRKALVSQHAEVNSTQEIFVKDLGTPFPQLTSTLLQIPS
jgi:very-long-chain enoyl-CoA reductase